MKICLSHVVPVLAFSGLLVGCNATAQQTKPPANEISEAIKKIAAGKGTSLCLHEDKVYSEGAVVKFDPTRFPPGQICKAWKWELCSVFVDSNGNPTGNITCPAPK